LGRPVGWALPPDAAKDVRAWTTDQRLPIERQAADDDWHAAGERFASNLDLHIVEPAGSPSQPAIVIGPDEHRVIREVTEALAHADSDLYQRGGQLVRVTRVMRPPTQRRRVRSSGGPRIEPLPLPDLRTRITRHCVLVHKKDQNLSPASPSAWLTQGVAAKATPWDLVRPLESVSETPLLRPDGTILQQPGYDQATGILFEPSTRFEPISDAVTRDDAIAARDELLHVVCDFPFASPELHSAAWLASVLTPLARPAFDGPAPLFLTDANIRGCGKALSASCGAIISTGRAFATAIYSHDPVEMQKTITAIAIAGEPLIMLDNLAGAFGNSSLDAALTSTEWQGRILGRTEQPRVPLAVCWYATGNNCVIAADTARRICHIRIESPDERPEERDGFAHRDLLGWVRAERPRLLRAALTILAAYCNAGRPMKTLKPWGSFEGWSDLIRQALVWIDLPDPADTRVALADDCDQDVSTLRALLAVWDAIVPKDEAATAAAVLQIIKAQPVERQAQHNALVSLCPDRAGGLPTPKQLGNILRRFKGRVCDRRAFHAEQDSHTKTAAWRVQG
jgi:hypothetical protein